MRNSLAMAMATATATATLAFACAQPNMSMGGDYQPDPEPQHDAASTEPIVLGTDADAGAKPSACSTVDVEVPASADTILIGGGMNAWCDGASHAGAFDVLNIGVGIGSAGAFRFPVTPELVTAITDPERGAQLELVLERGESMSTCGDACPFACGTLNAFGLRSDWDEGRVSASYDGADWCRRTKGKDGAAWDGPGATGAKDRGVMAGSIAVCDEHDRAKPKTELRLALDRKAVAPMLDAKAQTLSVLVTPAAGAVFTTAAREGAGTAARLHVTYCGG